MTKKTFTSLATVLACFFPFILQAAIIADYEAEISAPADGGSGPALWYATFDDATVSGHMDNSGSAGLSYQAYRLGGQSYTDYFGNTAKAYGLVNPPSQAAAVAGSTNLFMTGAQGTVSLLFKTTSNNAPLQVLFTQGSGFELAVFNGSTRLTYTSSGTKYASIGSALATDTWYYAALKWDTTKASNDLTWYLGQAGGSASTLQSGSVSIDAAGGNSSIVISGRTSANYFLSAMQQFAVWERELSGESIEEQYAALVPEPGTYALISGFMVLGFILIRRHARAKAW